MTLEQLQAEVKRAKRQGTLWLLVAVARLPDGPDVLVWPGVEGKVVSVSDGVTTAMVAVSDAEAFLQHVELVS